MKSVWVIVLVLIAVTAGQADPLWTARYNGSGNYDDHALGITTDAAMNVYVTGYTSESTWHENYFTTASYDSLGNERWVKKFKGRGLNPFARGTAVTRCNSFYYIYATGSAQFGTDTTDMLTIKFQPNGDTLWTRRYNGPRNGSQKGLAIAVDRSGYVFVLGHSTDTLGEYSTLVKYNSNGGQQWSRLILSQTSGLAVDEGGAAYVAGWIPRGSPPFHDIITVKFSPAGESVWTRVYNSPANRRDVARAILVDGSKNVYVAGQTWATTDSNLVLLKYDSLGNLQWDAHYDSPQNGHDNVAAIGPCRFGGVYLGGYSDGFGTSDDMLLIRYTSAGDSAWVRHYDGPASMNDAALCLAVRRPTLGEWVYLAGRSMTATASYDYIVVEYNGMSGVETGLEGYDGPQHNWDEVKAITVDASGNVVVTGTSPEALHSNDWCTIKYGPDMTSVEEAVKPSEPPTALLTVSPNPFTNATTISYSLSRASTVSLKLYDVTGKLVRTLASGPRAPGSYSIGVHQRSSAVGLVSGIYVLKLATESRSTTTKLIIE